MSYIWKEVKCDGGKPLARSSHSVDVVSGRVYVMGGEHEPRKPIGSTVWCLDVLQACRWSQLDTKGKEPPSRNAHASAVIGRSIYMFGGRKGVAMGEDSLSDLYKLDTDSNTWTEVNMSGPVPEPRSYHAMTAIGNTLYVFGGCTTSGRLNDLHAFDTDIGKWRSLPSSADVLGRGGAGLAAVGTKLYVVGGFTGKEMDDVHEFDTQSLEWRQINVTPSLPPSSVFGMASLGKKLIVIGGEVDPSSLGHAGAGKFSDQVQVLDTQDPGSGWRKVVPGGEVTMTPRGWFAASAFSENSVILFGGNSANNSRLDDTFVLEQESTGVAQRPSARKGQVPH